MNKVLHISDTQSLALLRMETELSALLDNAGQGFLTVDRQLKVLKPYSAECRRIFGRKIGGQPIAGLLWPDDPEQQKRLERLLITMLLSPEGERAVSYSDGLPNSFFHDGMRIRIDYKKIGTPVGYEEPRIMIILTDMTEHYRSREQLEFLSTHDTLTGMFNRNYVDKWMSEFRRRSFAPLSMVMADMNGLKLVNDVFGHLQGDEMLTLAGGLIRQVFGDAAVCARWGGDEFLVLLPDTDEKACEDKVRALKEACERTESYPIQVSMAIGTATMSRPSEDDEQLFLRAEKKMYQQKLVEGRSVRKKLFHEISQAMYAKGIEDPAHVERVGRLAEQLADRMGIASTAPDSGTLGLLARHHDVGKLAIPPETYRHAGPLTAEQWEIVRTHSETGYRLAFSLGEPALAEAILSMHERWDGRGYPFGLREEQIPELSRLVAIADAFDAMTHERVYRRALSRDEALREIAANAGTQFDPRLAAAFVGMMQGNG